MSQETRVGYASTSYIEEACLEYIKAFTKDGVFTGDDHYRKMYQKFHNYNRGIKDELSVDLDIPRYFSTKPTRIENN